MIRKINEISSQLASAAAKRASQIGDSRQNTIFGEYADASKFLETEIDKMEKAGYEYIGKTSNYAIQVIKYEETYYLVKFHIEYDYWSYKIKIMWLGIYQIYDAARIPVHEGFFADKQTDTTRIMPNMANLPAGIRHVKNDEIAKYAVLVGMYNNIYHIPSRVALTLEKEIESHPDFYDDNKDWLYNIEHKYRLPIIRDIERLTGIRLNRRCFAEYYQFPEKTYKEAGIL